MEEKEINLKAEEMNEILSSRPHWITRWGISIILIILIISFLSLYLIRPKNISLIKKIIIKFESKY